MTQEEKAKAYDEAREKIAVRFGINVAEEIFSEFEDSEDERIRKEIIQSIKGDMVVIHKDECIAWLEKQKQVKNTNKENEEVRQYIIRTMEQKDINVPMVRKALAWLEKQAEPVEWSEEDEKMFNRCLKTMKGAYYLDGEALYWLENRFKSLKPQNNITDEELAQAKKDVYNDALDKIEYHNGEPTFDDGWSAAIWYLKKRNIIPQNTWKPSDKQMKAIEHICDGNYNVDLDILDSIYRDFKKLREE